MRGLVLVDKMFRQRMFGVGVMAEVDVSSMDKLSLPLLAEVSARRVARVFFEVTDVFLLVGNDHLFGFYCESIK
jgi:hypothetical protein